METTGGGAPASGKTDAGIHYAYLGLAVLLYGVLAAWSWYHVREMTRVLEFRQAELPALSRPVFALVRALGAGIFVPLAGFVVLEVLAPRSPKLTRVYLVATLALVLAGIYVGIALYLPARALAG